MNDVLKAAAYLEGYLLGLKLLNNKDDAELINAIKILTGYVREKEQEAIKYNLNIKFTDEQIKHLYRPYKEKGVKK